MSNSISGFNNFSTYSFERRQSPEEMLKQYMREHNCTEEEAKAALESMYGKPQQNNASNKNNVNSLDAFKQDVDFSNFNKQYNNIDDIENIKNKNKNKF